MTYRLAKRLNGLATIVLAILLLLVDECASQCQIPDELIGEFYSYENGYETFTNIYPSGLIKRKQYSREAGAGASGDSISTLRLQLDEQGSCMSMTKFYWKQWHPSRWHYKMHYRPTSGVVKDCSQCVELYVRTSSVLEMRRSSCNNNPKKNFTELCEEIAETSSFITLFNRTYQAQECRSTIYGTYQFQ